MAPNLYLVVRFKKRNVTTELRNFNWARNCTRLDSTILVEEFVMLFMALSGVQLRQEKDQIFWRWTSDGKYSVASAYECQFLGSMTNFPAIKIWQAQVEPKCRLFAWLVMHNRLLTADNMIKRNWDCNPICPLCLSAAETTTLLLTECNYIEPVWNNIAAHFLLPDYNAMKGAGRPQEWVRHLIQSGTKDKEMKLGYLFAFWWAIWKERNRRIFDRELSVPSITSAIIEDINLFWHAHDLDVF